MLSTLHTNDSIIFTTLAIFCRCFLICFEENTYPDIRLLKISLIENLKYFWHQKHRHWPSSSYFFFKVQIQLRDWELSDSSFNIGRAKVCLFAKTLPHVRLTVWRKASMIIHLKIPSSDVRRRKIQNWLNRPTMALCYPHSVFLLDIITGYLLVRGHLYIRDS